MQQNWTWKSYIESFHKESEIRAAYLEQSTAHFNKVANINVGSDIITSHKKKNGREEDRQEYFQISFNKNEENKSIITSKTI